MVGVTRNRLRLHNLKRPKIRADMKKENLYNLFRAREPRPTNKTYFQQKWRAKSMTRAYHGERLKERQWIHMHTPTIPAAIPMNPEYLARSDGRDQSAGRGSGLETDPNASTSSAAANRTRQTPYMQMTFHPMERRLDTAIFRSLFASSARQARQMVVHGQVKVNGKRMREPGYMLNPGDMFQVDVERVMYALGKMKGKGTMEEGLKTEDEASVSSESEEAEQAASASAGAAAEESPDAEDDAAEEVEEEEVSENDPLGGAKLTLRSLRKQVTTLLETKKQDLSGARLRELRQLSRELRTALGKVATITPSELEDFEAKTQDFVSRPLKGNVAAAAAAAAATAVPAEEAPVSSSGVDAEPLDAERRKKQLEAALAEARENPHDPSKPYLTPWQPRDYMSPFAFVPRYLEVNHNVCAAVYLRHPICYPGFAEVPTPFGIETNTLAFNWYLRRR